MNFSEGVAFIILVGGVKMKSAYNYTFTMRVLIQIKQYRFILT